MPLISIVIPCYNSARFIRETVDSVLNQSLQDFEIIVVDDGSTDQSAEIVQSIAESVRIISGPNRGASAARDLGSATAEGEFIQYLDSDDILPQNALELRVLALEDGSADVAYSDWQQLVENRTGEFDLGEVIAREMASFDSDPEIAIARGFWCPPAALLYRRAIVQKIGGWHDSLPIIQDARFLLDAAFHGAKFVRVPQIGAYYRVRSGASLSRRDKTAFVRDCFENAREMKDRWRSSSQLSSKQKDSLLAVFSYVARGSYEIDRALFESALRELYELDPNWVPTRPHRLAFASRIFGYRNAEFLATKYRRIKKCFYSAGR